ncbi:MAG: peptidoglycan editing factor PgeF [Gammaproteobacteria bacterium]
MTLSRPEWHIPDTVRARFTVRDGGVSDPPFHSWNLSAHVGDDPGAVGENRMRLRTFLPAAPRWLRQAHTARAASAEEIETDATVADAAYTFAAGVVCAVTVADCLPVLFYAADGGGVAAAHAGWRGLSAGVLENTAAVLRANGGGELRAWIGPAIGGAHYEIGAKVRAALRRDGGDDECFVARGGGKWLADLPRLAARRLRDLDVETTASGLCTYSTAREFFSARRDGVRCGRIAAMIWKDAT